MDFGDGRYDVRELRHLRRRQFQLQYEINVESTFAAASAGNANVSDSTRVDYYMAMRLKQEELAELQYVLDHFERLANEWPSRTQWLFMALVVLTILVSILAVWQTVT